MTRDDVVEAMAQPIWKAIHDGDEPMDAAREALSALESLGIALVPVKALKPINFLAGLNEGDPDSKSVFVALGVLRRARDAADALSASPLRKTEGGEE